MQSIRKRLFWYILHIISVHKSLTENVCTELFLPLVYGWFITIWSVRERVFRLQLIILDLVFSGSNCFKEEFESDSDGGSDVRNFFGRFGTSKPFFLFSFSNADFWTSNKMPLLSLEPSRIVFSFDSSVDSSLKLYFISLLFHWSLWCNSTFAVVEIS